MIWRIHLPNSNGTWSHWINESCKNLFTNFCWQYVRRKWYLKWLLHVYWSIKYIWLNMALPSFFEIFLLIVGYGRTCWPRVNEIDRCVQLQYFTDWKNLQDSYHKPVINQVILNNHLNFDVQRKYLYRGNLTWHIVTHLKLALYYTLFKIIIHVKRAQFTTIMVNVKISKRKKNLCSKYLFWWPLIFCKSIDSIELKLNIKDQLCSTFIGM